MKPEIIAFHLPQYHEIPENDEWWGKGFTEWRNVKKARPLFEGHNQPRVPLDKRYYDLSRVEEIRWQCELAEKYNLYGFCYYHYWFNGHKLLEKPVELLRAHSDIKIKYCLCWANETWARTWDGRNTDILIEQKYGNKKDWIAHIQYLEQFFQDERYICVDGCPMLVIYKTRLIEKLNDMIACWQEYRKAKKEKPIAIVEVFQGQNRCYYPESVAHIEFEPTFTWFCERTQKGALYRAFTRCRMGLNKIPFISKRNFKFTMFIRDYDELWKQILQRKRDKTPVYLGAFIDWDNSARKGNRGNIISGSTPEKFEYYLKEQLKIAKFKTGSQFVFINAWNEWAEGTYLEPDEKNKYGYLEALQNAKRYIDFADNTGVKHGR